MFVWIYIGSSSLTHLLNSFIAVSASRHCSKSIVIGATGLDSLSDIFLLNLLFEFSVNYFCFNLR